MTLVVLMLIVFGALWLGTRMRRAGPRARVTARERVDAPPVLPREAEAPPATSPPLLARERPASRAAVPTTRVAVPRATTLADRAATVSRSTARSSATGYMLRRRGLCSPDPHI